LEADFDRSRAVPLVLDRYNLATSQKEEMTSLAVNVSNIVGLFSGANAFFPEAGEPQADECPQAGPAAAEGFTTALWRHSNEITTADCREMLAAAGFSSLIDTHERPRQSLEKNG
jgi:hypothetical protein